MNPKLSYYLTLPENFLIKRSQLKDPDSESGSRRPLNPDPKHWKKFKKCAKTKYKIQIPRSLPVLDNKVDNPRQIVLKTRLYTPRKMKKKKNEKSAF